MGKVKKSSSEDSESSSSNSSEESRKLKKIKRKERKAKKKLKKLMKKNSKELKKLKKHKSKHSRRNKLKVELKEESDPDKIASDIPITLMEKSKSLAPMTKEEWEKKQSIIRRVLDPESGRYRLIKGDGEVLEEIVSQKRHVEINKQATSADGTYFQSVINKNNK